MAGKSLKDIVAQAHGLAPKMGDADKVAGPQLEPFFSPLMYAWYELPEEQRAWSPEALEHCRKFFAGEYVKPRIGRFSPSSMGDHCERVLLFSYAGAPKQKVPVDSARKMSAGTFEHVRWQMEGLSAGYLDSVEVWVHSEQLRCGGSIDGVLKGRLAELKNTQPHLHEPIATGRGRAKEYAADMVRKHKLQMEAYWLVDEMGAEERGEERKLTGEGSLIYQEWASKDIFEIPMRTDAKRRAEVREILDSLEGWVELNALPEMLDGCWKAFTAGEVPTKKEETVYRRCAYREHCTQAQTVTVEDR